MKTKKQRDPLAPIETVVGAILLAMAVATAAAAVIALVETARTGDTSVGFAGFGDERVCAEHVTNVPTFSSSQRPVTQGVDRLRRDRAQDFAESWRVCFDDPSLAERIGVSTGPVLRFAALVAALLILYRAIRTARRSGLFTARTAGRVRVLGWFLAVTSIVVPIAESAATTWVMSGLVRDWDGSVWLWGMIPFSARYSALALVVAVGIITFARILERAVPLQEEVDATV